MENKTNKKEKTGISKKIPQLYNRMIFEVLIMINLLLRIISQKLKITLKIQGNKMLFILFIFIIIISKFFIYCLFFLNEKK